MEIEKIAQEGKVVYRITGRIDTQTSPEFQTQLDESFDKGEVNLVLDFENVEYLSSAGLRTILYAQKRINGIEGGSMIIVGVGPTVMEVFDMTGFTEFLTLEAK